jgi:DNA topoisomerase-1
MTLTGCYSGDKFTAKDFRTRAVSKIFFETLYESGYHAEEKENKKTILDAIDAAAEGLGNQDLFVEVTM